MRITSKGQVTIPVNIREAMGLLPHTEVAFKIVRGKVMIEKVQTVSKRGNNMIDMMKGQGEMQMSTDQIMALTRGDE